NTITAATAIAAKVRLRIVPTRLVPEPMGYTSFSKLESRNSKFAPARQGWCLRDLQNSKHENTLPVIVRREAKDPCRRWGSFASPRIGFRSRRTAGSHPHLHLRFPAHRSSRFETRLR